MIATTLIGMIDGMCARCQLYIDGVSQQEAVYQQLSGLNEPMSLPIYLEYTPHL